MDEKGVSRLSVGKVQSQIAAKPRERTIQGFRKVLVSKILCVVGVSRFCRSFLSHSTEKIRRGPLCLGNVLVFNFWITSYHSFVEFFCLIAVNHSGRNLPCFRIIMVSKFLG